MGRGNSGRFQLRLKSGEASRSPLLRKRHDSEQNVAAALAPAKCTTYIPAPAAPTPVVSVSYMPNAINPMRIILFKHAILRRILFSFYVYQRCLVHTSFINRNSLAFEISSSGIGSQQNARATPALAPVIPLRLKFLICVPTDQVRCPTVRSGSNSSFASLLIRYLLIISNIS